MSAEASPTIKDVTTRRSKPSEDADSGEERNGTSLGIERRVIRNYPDLELHKFFAQLKHQKRRLSKTHTPREAQGSSALKMLMRSMPHSTALITTLANEQIHLDSSLKKAVNLSPYARHFRGAVVSSLTSVTLGPPAIVSFNFKEPSATLDGIRANRFFTIHFLNSDTNGANVATHFLQHPGDHYASWKALSVDHELSVSKQLNLISSKQNAPQVPVAPVIRGPGIAAHITCEILPEKCITKIGDHSIIVAKVVTGPLPSKTDPDARTRLSDGIAPLLLYSEGHFRVHGNKIATTTAKDVSGETPEQEPAIHSQYHSDMINRRAVITAGEPDLYRAASAYIGTVLDKYPSDTNNFKLLSRFSRFMLSSSDRRARFVAALTFWQFERSVARREPNEKILDVPEEGLPDGGQNAFITRDSRLVNIAEELAEVAISGRTDAPTQRSKVPPVKPRHTPSTHRAVDSQDQTKSREVSSGGSELRIRRQPSRMSEIESKTLARLQEHKRWIASSTGHAQFEKKKSQGGLSNTDDFHVSVGDALRQAELELSKHEKPRKKEVVDAKVEPEAVLPGPSFSDFHV